MKQRHSQSSHESLNARGPNLSAAVRARFEERRLGKNPHATPRGRRANFLRYEASGASDLEYRHILIDYQAGSKHLKVMVMSIKEAWRRNLSLEGSGFAWAMCGT